jgi:WD40 repeat protein/energy-coupling factor transporter ATP-binding protein EcfA2
MTDTRSLSDPGLDCPYPGLRPFNSDEAHLFFGRARQIGDMLARLETRRFLAVVGASGCGKSSLVRAGLIPAIRDGWLASQATDWRIAIMLPGSDPFGALTTALLAPEALGPERAGPPNAAGFLESALRRGRLGLREAVAESGLAPQTGLLLVVDQFEEVFRFRNERQGRDDADAFVDLLLASTQAGASLSVGWVERSETHRQTSPVNQSPPAANPIQIILTMRSDYLGNCAVFTGLPEAINDSQFLTPRLTRDQYQDAIREPARLQGADLDPRLVSRLLNDMGEDPNRLPVLQHALMRMWTSAAANPEWNRVLTLDDYPAGGLAAALSNHCDDIYQNLANEEEQRLAEVMFRALCERTDTRRDTRRPQSIAELAAVAGVPPESLYPVIETFRHPDRSLLTPPVPEPLGPETVVDIGHESLIGHWQRLSAWVDAEEESAHEYQRLADAAQLQAAGEGSLLHGQNLQRMLDWKTHQQPSAEWAQRYGGNYSQVMDFLERSRLEEEAQRERQEAERTEQEATRQRELETAQALAVQKARAARNLLIWLAVCGCLMVLAIGAAWWAWDREEAARTAETVAKENAEAAEAQRKTALESRAKWFTEIAGHDKLQAPQRSLLLALEAQRAAPQLPATETTMREVLGHLSGTPLIGHEGLVNSVAFAPDGRALASASADGTIRLWDLTRPASEPRVLRGHVGSVRAIAFAPDGSTLASGSDDKTIRLWDLTHPGSEPRVLHGHRNKVDAVAVSPDGQTLASGSGDQTIRLWDLTDPNTKLLTILMNKNKNKDKDKNKDKNKEKDNDEDLFKFLSPLLYKRTLAFAPNSLTLASSSSDKTILLWDLTRPKSKPRVLRGHEGWVNTVAFASDGRTLASASSDQTIRLWDLTHPNSKPRVLLGHEGWVNAVAFSAKGRWLASGSSDKTIRLWDLARPEEIPQVLRGHEDDVNAVAFTRDERTLASGSSDRTIRLWDPTVTKLQHNEEISRIWIMDIKRVCTMACKRLTMNLSSKEWSQYFDPEAAVKTCPNLPIHPSFLKTADALAQEGKVEKASAVYREVLASFDSHEFDPLARARLLAAPGKIEASVTLAEAGKVDEALAAYAEAKRWDPEIPITAEVENSLCWSGSLWGRGRDLLPRCERAVELAPEIGLYQDSRGIARAQAGDLAGAVEDFQAFLTRAGADPDYQAHIPKRRQWIEALKQGRNPFDAATLEALRRDELSPDSAGPSKPNP